MNKIMISLAAASLSFAPGMAVAQATNSDAGTSTSAMATPVQDDHNDFPWGLLGLLGLAGLLGRKREDRHDRVRA